MSHPDKENKIEVRKIESENGIEFEIKFGEEKIRIPKSHLKDIINILEQLALQANSRSN